MVLNKLKEKTGRDFLGPIILVPENKHYSWIKGVSLMGLGKESYWPVELDAFGRLSASDLKLKIAIRN